MLAESVPEPVDEKAEGIDRQTCLFQLWRLLGKVQCPELEQPIAVVGYDILRGCCSQVLSNLEELLLGRFVLLVHGPEADALEIAFGRVAPRSTGGAGASGAGRSSGSGAFFALPRHAMFPLWCPQAAHAASVRGDN